MEISKFFESSYGFLGLSYERMLLVFCKLQIAIYSVNYATSFLIFVNTIYFAY
jgi:hypothetical protein